MARRTRSISRPRSKRCSGKPITRGCASIRSPGSWRRTTGNGSCKPSTRTSRLPRFNAPRHQGRPEVTEVCRRQLNFGDGLIAEEVADLWEDWMRHVDVVLEDPLLLNVAYEALACRWK